MALNLFIRCNVRMRTFKDLLPWKCELCCWTHCHKLNLRYSWWFLKDFIKACIIYRYVIFCTYHGVTRVTYQCEIYYLKYQFFTHSVLHRRSVGKDSFGDNLFFRPKKNFLNLSLCSKVFLFQLDILPGKLILERFYCPGIRNTQSAEKFIGLKTKKEKKTC